MEVFFDSSSLLDVRNAVRTLRADERQQRRTMRPVQILSEPFINMGNDVLRFLSPESQWSLNEFGGTLIGATKTEPGRVEADFVFKPQYALPEDFSQTFSYAYIRRGNVEVNGQTATIHAERIGCVYPLEQALNTLSSPFYLLRTEAKVDQALDTTRKVAVKTTLVDLAEYNRLQINSGRRIARALERRFPHNP